MLPTICLEPFLIAACSFPLCLTCSKPTATRPSSDSWANMCAPGNQIHASFINQGIQYLPALLDSPIVTNSVVYTARSLPSKCTYLVHRGWVHSFIDSCRGPGEELICRIMVIFKESYWEIFRPKSLICISSMHLSASSYACYGIICITAT